MAHEWHLGASRHNKHNKHNKHTCLLWSECGVSRKILRTTGGQLCGRPASGRKHRARCAATGSLE